MFNKIDILITDHVNKVISKLEFNCDIDVGKEIFKTIKEINGVIKRSS